jgi:uncharacterized membrane protein
MIIMALDHTREFFHIDAMSFAAENLARSNGILFLTRWITHICAPTFLFTAGLAAFYWSRRPGRTSNDLSKFLLRRGFWIILLEFTVFRFAVYLSLTKGLVFLITLWAIGWSMVALAGLSRLPMRILAPLSVVAIFLHNLLDPIQNLGWFWNILHQQGFLPIIPGVPLVVGYPLIPWIFVMSAGFCFGQIMTMDADSRKRWLLRIGSAAVVLFLGLRGLNLYGDPRPWTTQFPGMTFFSFLNVTKNPPSLDFLLMTLGPAILLLALFDGRRFSNAHPLMVFGRTPLFYFLGHFLLIRLLTIPAAWLRYGRVDFLLAEPLPSMGGKADLYPKDFGYDLFTTYLIWIAVVILMYPLCNWYSRWEANSRLRRQQGAAPDTPLRTSPLSDAT